MARQFDFLSQISDFRQQCLLWDARGGIRGGLWRRQRCQEYSSFGRQRFLGYDPENGAQLFGRTRCQPLLHSFPKGFQG